MNVPEPDDSCAEVPPVDPVVAAATGELELVETEVLRADTPPFDETEVVGRITPPPTKAGEGLETATAALSGLFVALVS